MKTEPSQQFLKSRLREENRHLRAGIGEQERRRLDSEINRHLLEFSEQSKPSVIAAFQSFDGEPNLAPALTELRKGGVRVALPVVLDAPDKPLIIFRQWTSGSQMRKNRYGIPEPVGTLEIQIMEIDLVLLPLVAWDESGGRLGMGASFYDRFFQPLSELNRPLRMGVGYELQKTEKIPLEPWDIRLHHVLSENGCLPCKERQ